jgi:integrase
VVVAVPLDDDHRALGNGTYAPLPCSEHAFVVPHELRHTCASLLVAQGASVLAVARQLGHADPSVTLRVYADLFDEQLGGIGAHLDDAIRAARSDLSRSNHGARALSIIDRDRLHAV